MGGWRKTASAMAGILAAWSVLGLFLAQQMYVVSMDNGNHPVWLHTLVYELAYCYPWALATVGVIRLGRRYPLGADGQSRNVIIHLFTSICFAILTQSLYEDVFAAVLSGGMVSAPDSEAAR